MPILNFKFSCQLDVIRQEILNFVPKEEQSNREFLNHAYFFSTRDRCRYQVWYLEN